jgi:hypothetical protein
MPKMAWLPAWLPAWLLACLLTLGPSAPVRGDAGRSAAESQIDARAAELVRRAVDDPFPKSACPAPPAEQYTCTLGMLAHAFASLYADDKDPDAAANEEFRLAVGKIEAALRSPRAIAAGVFAAQAQTDEFHFVIAALVFRTVVLFGQSGIRRAGALSSDNEKAATSLFWEWASHNCRMKDAAQGILWNIWGSENHDAQRVHACWAAATLLAGRTNYAARTYDDGSRASDQSLAWTSHLKAYASTRGLKGLFVEYFSPTYSAYTLLNFYNLADFSPDPVLKRLAKSLLNLWWACWAQEQVNGNHGGSEARVYPRAWARSPGDNLSWLYFGLRPVGLVQSPVGVLIATSAFRPSRLVHDIAVNTDVRGKYEIRSRVLGLVRQPTDSDWYYLDPSRGAQRYAYVTPDFVMGTLRAPALKAADWAAMSSQNRWNGIALADGPGRRVFALPRPQGARSGYNAVWGFQDKGTQIIQKLPPALSRHAGDMRIWLTGGLKPTFEDGWIFISGSAFVAARPAFGGFRWDDATGSAVLGDERSPVVIHAAPKRDFASWSDFRRAVAGAELRILNNQIVVNTLEGREISFPLNFQGQPLIDGNAIDANDGPVYASRFVVSGDANDVVTITNGRESEILDFGLDDSSHN